MQIVLNESARRIPSATPRCGWFAHACVLVGLLVIVLTTGCEELFWDGEIVGFSYDNRTDSALCTYESVSAAMAAECLDEVEPHALSRFASTCGDLDRDEALRREVTEILTVRASGHQIYERTETCRAWQDSNSTLTVEEEGGEFVVTDDFAD